MVKLGGNEQVLPYRAMSRCHKVLDSWRPVRRPGQYNATYTTHSISLFLPPFFIPRMLAVIQVTAQKSVNKKLQSKWAITTWSWFLINFRFFFIGRLSD